MSNVVTVTPTGRKTGGAHRISDTPASTTSKKYYDHIDGLRGLAIGLVVFFHVFIGKVSSGVDVFLFIGGLLFLTSQVKNAQNPQGLTFFQSTVRILRRLVPALVVVVFATMIYLLTTTTKLNWKSTLLDGAAAQGYWMNWRLIDVNQDYAAAGSGVSPFQHLWSMSVQLQIYLSLLVFISLACWLGRKFKVSDKLVKDIIIYSVAVATVVSFIYASYSTLSGAQSKNYYSTYSRFWEIGLGCVCGLFLLNMVFARYLRWMMSIIGLCAIISVGLFLNGVEQFPGALTLIPIVGAMLIIAAGQISPSEKRTISSLGPVIWILESKPMTSLGKIAYSLYLWHWPLLIAVVTLKDIEKVSILQGIIIIAVSVVLAVLTYFGIEKPLRQKGKPQRGNIFSTYYIHQARVANPSAIYPAAAVFFVSMFAVLTLAPYGYDGLLSYQNRKTDKVVAAAGGYEVAYPGAQALLNDSITAPDNVPINPNLEDMDSMMPPTQKDGCFSMFEDTKLITGVGYGGQPCVYGDVNGKRTMYLLGGSHSEQYLPALENIAQREGIKIIPILKMGCALYQPYLWSGEDYPSCYEEWSPAVEQYVIDNPPTDGVIITSTRPTTMWGGGPEIAPDYYVKVAQHFGEKGIHTYAIRDNPWNVNKDGPFDPKMCLYNGGTKNSCGMDWGFTMDVNGDPAQEAFKNVPNVKLLDFSNMFQKDGRIYPVIGNVLVFRDNHHLTRQYVLTMEKEIERQMRENPWTFGTDAQSTSSMALEQGHQVAISPQK